MNSVLFIETTSVFSLEHPFLQSVHQREPKCAYLGKCPKMYQSWSACREAIKQSHFLTNYLTSKELQNKPETKIPLPQF